MKINPITSFQKLLILHIPLCLCHVSRGSAVLIHVEQGCGSVGLRQGKGGPRVNLMTRHVPTDLYMVF